MADEDGLAAPFDDDLFGSMSASRYCSDESRSYVFALGYRSQVDFDLCLREHVCGGGHVDQEICIRARLSAIAFSHLLAAPHFIFQHF